MDISFDLLINAIVAGLLLGAFYAAVTAGVSISFGMLDIVNIAHPGFVILGSYLAYFININYGVDPIVISILMLPVFFALGAVVYQVYYLSFERRGQEALRGLAFFFGLLFVTEVTLILVFGVDYRYVEAAYIGPSIHIGLVDMPLRMLVPCMTALALFAAVVAYLCSTNTLRAAMIAAPAALLAYGMVVPWMPPSTIAIIRQNAPYLGEYGGVYASMARNLAILGIVFVVVVAATRKWSNSLSVRFSAIFSFSMICVARILPMPGSDCRTAETLSLPTMSSDSARSRTAGSVVLCSRVAVPCRSAHRVLARLLVRRRRPDGPGV